MLDGKKGQNAGENKQTNKTPQLCVGGGLWIHFSLYWISKNHFYIAKESNMCLSFEDTTGPALNSTAISAVGTGHD